MQGTKVIVIDPEREYKQLANSVNGTYIRLSAKSKEKINPFDFSINKESELSEHIQDLTEIISLMAGGLNAEERAGVDKAILQTYKDFGWLMTPKVKVKKNKKEKRGRKPKEKLILSLRIFIKPKTYEAKKALF